MRDSEIDIPRAELIPILTELGVTFCKDCLRYTGLSETTAFRLGAGLNQEKF